MHIALLGDSTFDNAAYTDGGKDVVTHLNDRLVGRDRATLLAVDGAIVRDVEAQIGRLERLTSPDTEPEPVTHVVLSVGGNDLLGEIDVMFDHAGSVGAALLRLRERSARFGEAYAAAVDRLLEAGLPTVLCTVYQGHFQDEREAETIETALRIYDHEILNTAVDRALPVIDLRRVCTEPEDYWNPIEPSERGGEKIAEAVLGAVRVPRVAVNGGLVTLQGVSGLAR